MAAKVLQFLTDRLTNLVSGMGTTVDKRSSLFYAFAAMTGQEAEAAYRNSWLAKKIVDVPGKDMTREWRDWKTSKDKIELIEKEERRLQLRAKVQRCLILARMFGGAGLVLGIADKDQMEPIAHKVLPNGQVEYKISKGDLRYVRAMSRYQLVEGPPREDPLDPWVDEPEFYQLSNRQGGQVKLHPSRVVPFIGQRAPEGGFYAQASWFWGDPVMQSVGDAVKNADLAQAGFSALIDQAKLDIIKIPELLETWSLDENEDQLKNRLSVAQMAKSVFNALILDGSEEWEQRQITWAGIPDTMFAFLNVVAGAADIPLTRLLGTSPKGLQSTGDGEDRDYNKMVKAWQEDLLEPALDRVDDIMLPSVFGTVPSDIYWEFAPLTQLDEKEAAEVENKHADTVKKLSDTGLLPPPALAKITANGLIERGNFPGAEAAFEEHRKELENPDDGSEEELQTLRQQVAGMQKAGKVTQAQADQLLLTDASPRSLYVRRDVVNAAEIRAWAKGQGIKDVADDLHVTLIYSRTPMDWIKAGNANDWSQEKDGRLTIPAGGPRVVEPLGDITAVLMFASSELSWRHRSIVQSGASHDFEDYIPHISLTKAQVDLSQVEPYRGKIVLGPEIFEEVKSGIEE